MKSTYNVKELGEEYVQPEESKIIEEFITEMKSQVDRLYKGKFMKRQVHTKTHGNVKARFLIEDSLPEEYRVGVFSEKKTFDAWVRFSNASTTPKPDAKKDIRGCAIKLLDIPGEKILKGYKEETTQDFLLMSNETFFSRNLKEFRGLLKASTAPRKSALVLYFLNPMHWGLLKRFLATNSTCANPLEIQYWSTQPFRFGSEKRAVKYSLRPSEGNQLINENTHEENYLHVNLAQTLNSNSVSFDFLVQFQEDAEKMPIEDPTVPWNSPFVKLGTLTIDPQRFDREEQIAFGEDLSFNPWHALSVHRPLGGFNRARKAAYIEMSKYRHEKNSQKMEEPTVESFSTNS